METFELITPEQWEELPAPTPKKVADKWDEVIKALEAGGIVKLETSDEKDLTGKRIGLGRKAKEHGFKVDYRRQDNTLYVRRGADVVAKSSNTASATGGKRRGRPRKEETGPQPQSDETKG